MYFSQNGTKYFFTRYLYRAVLAGLDEAEDLAVVVAHRRANLHDRGEVFGQRLGLEVRGRAGLADRDVGGVAEREGVWMAIDS